MTLVEDHYKSRRAIMPFSTVHNLASGGLQILFNTYSEIVRRAWISLATLEIVTGSFWIIIFGWKGPA